MGLLTDTPNLQGSDSHPTKLKSDHPSQKEILNNGRGPLEISRLQLLNLLSPDDRTAFLLSWPIDKETILVECSPSTSGGYPMDSKSTNDLIRSPSIVSHCIRCQANLGLKKWSSTGSSNNIDGPNNSRQRNSYYGGLEKSRKEFNNLYCQPDKMTLSSTLTSSTGSKSTSGIGVAELEAYSSLKRDDEMGFAENALRNMGNLSTNSTSFKLKYNLLQSKLNQALDSFYQEEKFPNSAIFYFDFRNFMAHLTMLLEVTNTKGWTIILLSQLLFLGMKKTVNGQRAFRECNYELQKLAERQIDDYTIDLFGDSWDWLVDVMKESNEGWETAFITLQVIIKHCKLSPETLAKIIDFKIRASSTKEYWSNPMVAFRCMKARLFAIFITRLSEEIDPETPTWEILSNMALKDISHSRQHETQPKLIKVLNNLTMRLTGRSQNELSAPFAPETGCISNYNGCSLEKTYKFLNLLKNNCSKIEGISAAAAGAVAPKLVATSDCSSFGNGRECDSDSSGSKNADKSEELNSDNRSKFDLNKVQGPRKEEQMQQEQKHKGNEEDHQKQRPQENISPKSIKSRTRDTISDKVKKIKVSPAPVPSTFSDSVSSKQKKRKRQMLKSTLSQFWHAHLSSPVCPGRWNMNNDSIKFDSSKKQARTPSASIFKCNFRKRALSRYFNCLGLKPSHYKQQSNGIIPLSRMKSINSSVCRGFSCAINKISGQVITDVSTDDNVEPSHISPAASSTTSIVPGIAREFVSPVFLDTPG